MMNHLRYPILPIKGFRFEIPYNAWFYSFYILKEQFDILANDLICFELLLCQELDEKIDTTLTSVC